MAGEGQKGHSEEKAVPTLAPKRNPARAGLRRGVSATASWGPGLRVTWGRGAAAGFGGRRLATGYAQLRDGLWQQPVSPSRSVPSVAGLAGAGLTIPLASLQTRLGNDLELEKHSMFLNTLCF